MRKILRKVPVSHVSLRVRIFLYGSCKRNCGILTLFRLVSLSIASLEFVFTSFLLLFASFCNFFRFVFVSTVTTVPKVKNFFTFFKFEPHTVGCLTITHQKCSSPFRPFFDKLCRGFFYPLIFLGGHFRVLRPKFWPVGNTVCLV
jgi:hypothetical protein